MIGIFRVLGRVANFLLRFRALRPLLALAALLWTFDKWIALVTDAAWFSSVNLGALWRTQLLWKAGVGATFTATCLVLSVVVMRAVARPVGEEENEPSLPRALESWQLLRLRATRLGWLALLLTALVEGRFVARHWSEFALWGAGQQSTDIAQFWMFKAPALATLLSASWKFALVLGAVALGAGALRALPFLAARPSVRPVRWLRALTFVGVALGLLRALGFAFEAAWHVQVANENEIARIAFAILGGLGALGCLGLIVLLRRPRFQLALWTVAVLLLPALSGDIVSLFAGRGGNSIPTPPPLDLKEQAPTVVPLGDAATLVRLARLQLNRDKGEHFSLWQSAGISTTRGGLGVRADIVGTRLVTDEWLRHGVADNKGDLTWQSLDLPSFSASQRQPLGPLFYGISGRPLLNEGISGLEAGVPIESWTQKLAWAWRLRDLFLPFDGTRAKRLMVRRGAQEIGQGIAPFWTWDEAEPRRDPQTGAAFFECIAYGTSANFPRRAAWQSGLFAGQNAVEPVAVLRLDARSGGLQVLPFAGSGPLATRWQRALPTLFGRNEARRAPTPALEMEFADRWSLVWTRTDAIPEWHRRALPIELRAQASDKLAEFAVHAKARPLNGATPVLWLQNKTLWLAQPFFSQGTIAKGEASPLPNSNIALGVGGIAIGPLGEEGMGWGQTLTEAQAVFEARKSPKTPSLSAPGSLRSLQELAQAALAASRAAKEALKKGRYVEAERQSEREHTLLEELARRTK